MESSNGSTSHLRLLIIGHQNSSLGGGGGGGKKRIFTYHLDGFVYAF